MPWLMSPMVLSNTMTFVSRSWLRMFARRVYSSEDVNTTSDKATKIQEDSADKWEIPMFEVLADGQVSLLQQKMQDIAQIKNQSNLPIRDMRMFYQSKILQESLPLILARPSSHCFLLSLEHIRLFCQKDRCLILSPEEIPVQSFAADLKHHLTVGQNRQEIRTGEPTMHHFLESLNNGSHENFEVIVLETALGHVVSKFKRLLNILKPVLDLVLQETSATPNSAMLRRILAFRKSLNTFEMSVKNVRSAVTDILREKIDLEGLCLSGNSKTAHDEMELLLEAYNSDLKEIECELRNIQEMIEDTNDFIKIHLNSTRNKMIRMGLFMEMGTLAVGSGALVAGTFGMNLTHGFEEHPTAFYVTTGGILFVITSVFGMTVRRYNAMNFDYTSARSYQALKHFFSYVENIEVAIQKSKGKTIDKGEFRALLEPVIGTQLSQEEIDDIFEVLDQNHDGWVNISELTHPVNRTFISKQMQKQRKR